MRLGAYHGADGKATLMESEAELDAWKVKVGRYPNVVMDYRNLGEAFPDMSHLAKHQIQAQMTIQLFENGYAGNTIPLTDISSGYFDPAFEVLASEVRKAAVRVNLRFAHEMNGDWYGWGAQPKNYVAAWRHMALILRKSGIGASKLIWCPNVFEPLKPYWPGDNYVDIVGLDGYNWGGEYERTFKEVFGPDRKRIRTFTHRPIVVCETSCTENGKKDDWFADAAKVAPGMFNEVTFFDRQVTGQRDWRIDSSDEALVAFRKLAQAWS